MVDVRRYADYPAVEVDGVRVINCGDTPGHWLTPIYADGKLRILSCFLGDMTKSRARKFRKAFNKAGWHHHAAVKSDRPPPGSTVYNWVVEIPANDEDK